MEQKLEKHFNDIQEGQRVCDLRGIEEVEEAQKLFKEMEERAFILSSDFRGIWEDCRRTLESLELWKELLNGRRRKGKSLK